jgi:hypothetical protein
MKMKVSAVALFAILATLARTPAAEDPRRPNLGPAQLVNLES